MHSSSPDSIDEGRLHMQQVELQLAIILCSTILHGSDQHAAAAARYMVGQKFGKHIDDSVEIEGRPGHVTGYTLLVYLSGTFEQLVVWCVGACWAALIILARGYVPVAKAQSI